MSFRWTDVQSQREFLIDVESTWKQVLEQEDTDGDCKITVLDQGPKVRREARWLS